MKIAIVTNILPPYRVPLFNQIAATPGVDLRVFLNARTEPNRHWRLPASDIHFAYEIGSTFSWSPRPDKTIYINPGLVLKLRRFQPDVVIAGATTMIGLASWLGAKLSGAAFISWWEATAESDRRGAGWLKGLLRRFLVCQSQAYVAASGMTADYYTSLGADRRRVFVSLQTLDVASFGQQVQRFRAGRKALKEDLGLSGLVVSYIGNLEPYKGPDLLLRTFLKVLADGADAHLLLVGSGAMADELTNQAESVVGDRVHFIGFKQHNELPAFYAISDLFCLFSRSEPFGVVVTEAIAAGLPVMCSKFAGAAHDLVRHGENGFVIDPEDTKTNARLMRQILQDPKLRSSMGQRSLEMALKCSIQAAAENMLKAAVCAVGQS